MGALNKQADQITHTARLGCIISMGRVTRGRRCPSEAASHGGRCAPGKKEAVRGQMVTLSNQTNGYFDTQLIDSVKWEVMFLW